MSVIETLPTYASTEDAKMSCSYGRSFEKYSPKRFIAHTLIDRYKKKISFFKSLEEKNVLSSKVIDNNFLVLKYLDQYLPNSNDREIFFEEDEDNSILNFVEINHCNIILNVFENRIEYSFENELIPNSLLVGQISFEKEKIVHLLNDLIQKGGLTNQFRRMS